ncbi:MAG TPA: SRPBCC family protein [Streptosporangiaceae bacterium]|nr:SRPBCC family protein [Streptosporangiaceae bacterium]
MTTRLTVTAGVVVDARQEQVWELAVDWAKQESWIWATRTNGGHHLGAHVTARTAIGPLGFTDPMVITEWDPPNRCTVTHQGNVVRGAGVFEVLPRGETQAEFRWTERIELPAPIGKPLAQLLIGPVTRIGLGASLRRFARLASASSRENLS